MSYDDSNSGTFGKNKNKEPGSKQPDWKGKINVNGVAHWLDGWVRQGQDGEKFISMSIKPKEAKPPATEPAPARQAPRSSSDDIPF